MNHYGFRLLPIFLFTLFFSTLSAQTGRDLLPPKLGLCLSGGGAKGLAHIGLLRMMDSLGIVPDYITGTSMGSIMGGLYAIGYSGDQLKEMALKADWPVLLSNKLPLPDINIEEKDEYGRYMVETPFIRGRLRVPRGFIEGQALQEYLIGLTFAARHIHSFDNFPIPFRCLASDIKTGKSVLLTEGSLPDALRASMAIPLFFTPVERDSLLLVDGGLHRNFPVKEVIDMGATKVIGSYTGFRLLNPDELGDGSKFIMQSIALMMSNSTEEDKKLCDMWVNNELPNLYSNNFDPKSVRAIIEGGEANARAMLPQLQKIADWQHPQNVCPKRSVLITDTTFLPVKSVEVNDKNARAAVLIKRKFGIEPNEYYGQADVKHGLNQLYGSLFFNKVSMNVDTADNGKSSIIRLRAHESAKAVFKFGAHYDTDDAAGILINGTFRNFIGYNSRLVVTADFAEHPKTHIRYYQFIGPNARYRWTFDGLFDRSLHNDFLFIKASEGRIKSRDKYINSYQKLAVSGQFIYNKSTLFFLELHRINDATKPQRDPRNNPIPNEISFLKNQSSQRGIAIGGLRNTLNAVFFPIKGEQLSGEIKLGLGHNSEFTTYQYKDSTKTGIKNQIITSHNQSYIRYRLDEQRYIPLSQNWSLGLQASLGAGFSLNKNKDKANLLDNPETFYIGGSTLYDRDNTLAFIGLRKAEIEFSQCLQFGVSGQYHLGKSFYFGPSTNIGRFSDSHKQFYTRLWDWQFVKDISDPIKIQAAQPTHILGYGLNMGYLSKIGPVNLLIHSNTFTHSWYAFFSFGFKMP